MSPTGEGNEIGEAGLTIVVGVCRQTGKESSSNYRKKRTKRTPEQATHTTRRETLLARAIVYV
jgi:hypothetical protein